jgi:hypothetical protein
MLIFDYVLPRSIVIRITMNCNKDCISSVKGSHLVSGAATADQTKIYRQNVTHLSSLRELYSPEGGRIPAGQLASFGPVASGGLTRLRWTRGKNLLPWVARARTRGRPTGDPSDKKFGGVASKGEFSNVCVTA